MYEQVEKPKESKSRSVVNSVAQKKSNEKKSSGFVDNRLGLHSIHREKSVLAEHNMATISNKTVQLEGEKVCICCGKTDKEVSSKEKCEAATKLNGRVSKHKLEKSGPQSTTKLLANQNKLNAENSVEESEGDSSVDQDCLDFLESQKRARDLRAEEVVKDEAPKLQDVKKNEEGAGEAAGYNLGNTERLVKYFKRRYELAEALKDKKWSGKGEEAFRKQVGTYCAMLINFSNVVLSAAEACPSTAVPAGMDVTKDIAYITNQRTFVDHLVTALVNLPGTFDFKSCDSAYIDIENQYDRTTGLL